MQPEGTALVNTSYFAELTARVNAINVCSDLQEVVSSVMASLQAEVTSIERQISSLLPLTTIPTDLGSVISWITNMATPYIAAYNNLIAQQAAVLAAIAELTSAIDNAASRIEGCVVTVPSIV
jgi:hypothetical protein